MLFSLPVIPITGETQFLAFGSADGGVPGEGQEGVHLGVVGGADDPGWHYDVPFRGGVGFAVGEEEGFLRVVEVGA